MSITSKERVGRLLTGRKADRIGKAEAPWPHTVRRWHEEGLAEGVHPADFFGMDMGLMVNIDSSFGLPSRTVEETDEFILTRDNNGVLVKHWKDEHGIPAPIEFSIRSREDWNRLRERLAANEHRCTWGRYGDYFNSYEKVSCETLAQAVQTSREIARKFFLLHTPDPYEATMARVGDETLLVWMATEPKLVNEMFDAHATLVCNQVESLHRRGIRADGIFVGGDIAYKNGLMFSPAMYRALLFPHHKRMFHTFHECGLRVIYHSDGRVTEAVPMLIEAGIDCLQPMEVQAGMDVGQLADAFGRQISFMGNVSVKALSSSKDEAVREARRRIRAGKTARGYIFHSDHSLPPTVSFENYQAVMEVVDEEGGY
ncbi:MAG: uroporphyrinogen decarboxylase family protein [Planctomycetota bacterium]|nr:uroporphyrinogen decarboxylase family protein [Planctomycetota bacterium]